ncbi:hypothetical protein KIN20_023227 [Parelaphostrongylus tenuis]|uniref:Uncharacterized protein n=1 Tax=Parelaphostrongylus tenuis TaxID=148309 RepID=A0AAD5MRQ6_PARTN|nr:hypothetical protein KIN20_023227 [Parelaphostrongylus tenuis]
MRVNFLTKHENISRPIARFGCALLGEMRVQKNMVDRIVQKALTSLTANMVELNREHWMKDAVDAERAGCTLTCQAIMLAVFETYA